MVIGDHGRDKKEDYDEDDDHDYVLKEDNEDEKDHDNDNNDHDIMIMRIKEASVADYPDDCDDQYIAAESCYLGGEAGKNKGEIIQLGKTNSLVQFGKTKH